MTTYCVTVATCKCSLLVIGFIYFATLSHWRLLKHRDVEQGLSAQNDTQLELMDHMFRKRREHIANICLEKQGTATSIHRRHFLLNTEHKLFYCWIHKVASTSWIAAFCKLANKTNANNLYYREINRLAAKRKEDILNASVMAEYFKFLIVRHPFERLVSAYRDRLQDNSHKTYQARIYLAHVLSQPQEESNRTRNHNMSLPPTFPEFVQWLLVTRPEHYDVHWNRYHDHCAPCFVSYDAIVHLEEQHYITKTLGIQLDHLQQSSGGETTRSVTCHYLKKLSHYQLDSLYDIYKLDFQMFGYDMDIYNNCNKDNSKSSK